MALISKKTDNALIILAYLHNHGSEASAREIADQYHLSRPFVANILKELCQRGYVASHRGVNGGYALARAASSISLKELLQDLEEGFKLSLCSGHEQDESIEDCSLLSACPIKTIMQELHQRLLEVLTNVTLADLLKPGAPSLLQLQTVRVPKETAVPAGV